MEWTDIPFIYRVMIILPPTIDKYLYTSSSSKSTETNIVVNEFNRDKMHQEKNQGNVKKNSNKQKNIAMKTQKLN